MNIFKAKEIYKRIPGLPSSQNPLRVIRGLWVSGTHLNILTEDAFMHLSNFNTTPCDIRHYTEITADWKYTDPNVKFTNLYDADFTVADYYTTSTTWDEESIVKYSNIYDQEIVITDYHTTSTDFDEELIVQYTNVHDADWSMLTYNYPVYTTLPDNTGQHPAEPTLEILAYTSTALEYDFN